MRTPPRSPRPAALGRALLALLGGGWLALLAAGCGRAAPPESPPRTGQPVAEPEPQPESAAAPAPAPPPPSSTGAAGAKPRTEEGRAGPPAQASRRRLDADEAPADPQVLRQRLDDAVKLAAPDCASARDRKQAICELANQICELVDRDPDVASVESYCSEAKQRCGEAERRTAERCK